MPVHQYKYHRVTETKQNFLLIYALEKSFHTTNTPRLTLHSEMEGRTVYFQCEQPDVVRVITIGDFPPDLLVTSYKISKYTARPPKDPSHFRTG